MEFTVDLQPEEYRQVMLWHQFASTTGRRINDIIGWGVLMLTPLTIVLLLLLAPDALSIWFWPVAIVAFIYASYSTLLLRYQIRNQAESILAQHPALQRAHYQVHEKGIKLVDTAMEEEEKKLFLPWKEIEQVRKIGDLYLLFVSAEMLLIIPKRALPDENQFRTILQSAGKIP
ncbi:MAG: YcxB family protein [Caldilineaceae bacterium]|nr:YcxB family protein [Caldilineaceae bacterium]